MRVAETDLVGDIVLDTDGVTESEHVGVLVSVIVTDAEAVAERVADTLFVPVRETVGVALVLRETVTVALNVLLLETVTV